MNFSALKWLCFLILLTQALVFHAQEHNYTQYTIEDGLPTNYVYGFVEDDRGYIWTYTEQGIARFDGYEWKAFGLTDGLATLDCYSMCPLLDGTFLVGGNGWPSIVDGDSIFKMPLPKITSKLRFSASLLGEGLPPKLSFVDDNPKYTGSLYVYTADSTRFYSVDDGVTFRGMQTGMFETEEEKNELENQIGKKSLLSNPYSTFLGERGRDTFTFWGSPYQYFLNGRVIGEPHGEQVTSFRGLFQGHTFQAYSDSMLFQYDSTFMNVVASIDISSWYGFFDVNRAFRAGNGDVWIATRTSGVIHVPLRFQKIKTILEEGSASSAIEAVYSIGGKVYAANDKSNLCILKGGELHSLRFDKYIKKDSRFQSLREVRAGELIMKRGGSFLSVIGENVKVVDVFQGKTYGDTYGCDFSQHGYKSEDILKELPFFYRRGVVLCSGFMLVEDSRQLVRLNDSGLCELMPSTARYSYDKRLLVDESEVYIGGNTAVIQVSSSNLDTVWQSDSISITALFTINDSTILLGTRSKGIFRLTFKEEAKLENLFSSRQVRAISQDPSGNFWAATYSGVYRFAETGEVNLHLTQSNGLPSSETYDLDFFADSVALGTASGLAVFCQDFKMKQNVQIPGRYVQVQNATVRGTKVTYSGGSIELDPGQDDLEIDFTLLHPCSGGEIAYKVQLIPYDREPIRQTSRSIRYSHLAAGNYTFTVTATAIDGSIYTLEQPLSIHVRAHLYTQWWFQLLCIFFVLGFAGLFFYLREKEKHRVASERSDNTRRMSELQLEALRSQMNPHFVFNALGSIQYYIQSEEKDLADSYLTKFAQLMRKYLDSSKRNLVTVGEEVALLTQYIELEKMRFDHAFTFKIIVDEEIDSSGPLPSMILQPFVENAIIHGLANRVEPGGEIIISIYDGINSTVVEIADNGIGIENSKKLKRRGHRSRATEITNDRIVALRNSGNAEIDLTYEVLHPLNLACPGTKATLHINFHPDEN
ncbi:MAG: sensor histidine kinase [Saprospiraceae bacterium]